MIERKGDFERGLHQETLKQVSQLSKQSEETGLKFKVTVEAVGPFVDEIKIIYPDGRGGQDYIEENSKRSGEL